MSDVRVNYEEIKSSASRLDCEREEITATLQEPAAVRPRWPESLLRPRVHPPGRKCRSGRGTATPKPFAPRDAPRHALRLAS